MTCASLLALPIALLVAACGAGAPPKPAEVPVWERPGLGGAVRPGMGSPAPGELAPDFELARLGGATMRLLSLRGSWVLLHFTASWCPYRDSEIAHLGELADAYAPRGLHVVVVDVEEDAATWETYARARVAPSVIALHDGLGDAAKRFAPPRAQPSFEDRAQVALDSTLLVDPKGTIRLFLMPDSAHFDPTFAAVRREIDRLMADDPKSPESVVEVVAAESGADVVVTLRIRPGYHIMSNEPSAPNYIATRVTLDGDVGPEPPVYPPASLLSLGDRSIATFAGNVEVRLAHHANASGQRVTVRYQACTATRCLFPVTQTIVVH